MRYLLPYLVACALACFPAAAVAQAWLPDRAATEGPGIKLGESLLLHPGVGLEGGYNSNPMRYSSDDLNRDVEGAGRLRVTPYLDLATRTGKRLIEDEGVIDKTPPKVNFRLGVAGYYDHFFTKQPRIEKQRHFGVDTHLNFVLFPEGSFSLLADAVYLRTLQPYESSADAWARHTLRPGLGVRIRPGGGTLSFETGYRLDFLHFEDPDLAERNDKIKHIARLVTSWKVLPKTALVSKVLFSPITYLGSDSINYNSTPIRSLFGIQGLLTNKFALAALAGYGASFYKEGDDFDSVIANLKLQFFITPFSHLSIGGERDFVDSLYANYYVKTGGFIAFRQMFGGIVLGTLKGDVFHRSYSRLTGSLPPLGATPSQPERSDIWASGMLLVEIRATDWLAFHVSAQYSGDITDFEYNYVDQNTGATATQPVDYHWFEAMAGVRGHY